MLVNTRHSLHNWVVSANATETFKARLDIFWHCEDIAPNFETQLHGDLKITK